MLPTPFDSAELAYPRKDQNIRGIATRKVYPLLSLLIVAVCSYHTFSPLPSKLGGIVSATLSVDVGSLPIPHSM